MFCEKCGAPLPDDAKFCANCGASVEEPNVSEQTPVSEENTSLEQTAVLEENSAEAEASVSAQPAESNTYYDPNAIAADEAFDPEPNKKFKLPKWVKISVIAVAAVAIVGVLFGSYIVNAVKLLIMSPTAYYASIEGDNISDYTNALGKKATVDPENYSGEVALSLELTDEGKTQIEDLTDVDISEYMGDDCKIEIISNINGKDDKMMADLGMLLNGSDIVSGSVIFDIAENELYGKVPIISDDYFLYDMSEVVSKGKLGGANLSEASQKELFNLIGKYSKVALKNGPKFEKSKDKLRVEGISANYTCLEAEITREDLDSMCIAVLEKLKDDKNATKLIVEDIVAANYQVITGGDEEPDVDDLTDEYLDGIDELIETLEDDMDSDYSDEELFVYRVWVNAKGEIMGREIELVDGEIVVGIYNVRKGGKQDTRISYEEYGDIEFEFSGVAKRSANTLKKGEYTVQIQGNDVLDVTLEKYSISAAEKANMDAEFTVKLSDGADEYLDGMSGVVKKIIKDFGLKFDIKNTDNQGDISITATYDDENLAILKLTSKIGNGKKVSVPSGAADVEDWANDIDSADVLDAIIEKLEKAGLSDEIIDALEGADIEDLFDALSGYQDYHDDYKYEYDYDDDYNYDYDDDYDYDYDYNYDDYFITDDYYADGYDYYDDYDYSY